MLTVHCYSLGVGHSCISSAGVYQYIEDLMACISPHSQVRYVWNQKLVNHPDQRFRGYITEGGFRVGAVRLHPEAIRDYLATKCAAGRIIGPLPRALHPGVHTNSGGMEVDCGPLIPRRGEC